MPELVIDTLPLEGREAIMRVLNNPLHPINAQMRALQPDAAKRDATNRHMIQNTEENQRTAILAAAAWLPRLAVMKAMLSEEERIGDFVFKARGERRKLLKAESKGK